MASQLAAHSIELSDDEEAVPLLEIPPQSIADRVQHDHVRLDREADELDDTLSPSHAPDCFKDCREVLESPPTLWTDKTEMPPDSWPRKWIAALVLCLWAAVLTNLGLAYLAYHMPESPAASAAFQVAPSLLATALMFIATQASHRALHHSSQRPMGMEAFETDDRIYSINRYFLIFLLGPQLSNPILKFSWIEEAPGGHATEGLGPMTPPSEWTGGFAESANFSSWADVVPSLEQLIPAQTSFFTARDLLKDWKETATDIWVIHDESVQRELPSTVSFSLHRDGRGSAEHIWDGRDREEKHGVYMPVVSVKQPVVKDFDIRHSWEAPTTALGLGLKCDYVESDYISVTKSLDTNGVAVKATDRNGCSAVVALEKLPLTKETRWAYLNLVGHLEDDAHSTLHGTALSTTLRFLEEQRALVLSYGAVFAYKPSWSPSMTTRDSASDRLCEHKLFLASTLQSVMLNDSMPLEATQVQAVSCSAVFAHGEVELVLEREPSLPLQGTTNRYKYAWPTYDSITTHTYNNYDPPYKPIALDEQAVERLTFALLDQDPSIHIWGSDWPLALLREEYEDHRWERASPVGTLRMVGKVLIHSFIGRLSTSASRTLAEALRVGYKPLVGSVLRWPSRTGWGSPGWQLPTFERLQNNVYQRYGIYPWYLLILLPILTLFLSKLFYKDFEIYFSPWDLSSIATRLALLRHSRIVKVLRNIPIDKHYLNVSGNTWLVTLWDDNGHGEAVEWRIDAMNDKSIQSEQGMAGRNYKPVFASVALLIVVALNFFLIVNIGSYHLDDLRLQFYVEIFEVGGLFNESDLWMPLVRSITQIILFRLAFSWLPSLALAYQAREPWVALKLPQTAKSSITLDYWNCFSPLWKAINHRHWTLAFLSFSSLLQFGVPLSSALLYTRDHSTSLTETHPALREHGWKKDITSIELASRETLEHVNLEFLNSLSCPGTTGSWATPVGALATTDVQRALPKEDAAYGTFRGSLLSATLDCQETEVKLEVSMHRTNQGDFFAVDTLAFTSQDDPIELQDPCRAVDKRDAVDSRPWNLPSFCGRWWLQNSTLYSGDESPQPTWLVVVMHGNATHRPDSGHMLFTKEPLVTGLACKPRVSVQEGTVTVPGRYTAKGKSGRAELFPAKFKASSSGDQGQTLVGVAGAVSQLLNTSMLLLRDNVAGGEDDEGRLFGIDTFVGDLPSYAIYRYFDTGRLAKPDTIALAEVVSYVFATYVSTLASSTDILKDITVREDVQISYYRSYGRIRINKASLVFLMGYVALCCYILAKYSRRWPSEYSLPLEPVLLINSLQYLSNSETLIWTMEREMPHPEKMSLREFHKKVELWGFKYQLKVRYKGGNRYVVLEIVDDANPGSQVLGPFGMVLTDDSEEPYKDDGEALGTQNSSTAETQAGPAE